MRRRILSLSIATIAGLVACRSDSVRPGTSTSMDVPAFVVKGQAENVRQLSPDESRIIEELVRSYPDNEAAIRALLSDRRVAAIEMRDLRAKDLLARLDSIRRHPSIRPRTAPSGTMNATVVLLDAFDDTSANAVVVRRMRPAADLILLSDANASGAALGAGIAALFKLRKEHGDLPHSNVRIVVSNGRMPTKWPPLLKGQAEQLVEKLRVSEKREVQGFGLVRSMEIPLQRVQP